MHSRILNFIAMFVGGLILFAVLNLIAAHVRSDCGLAAVFGVSGCADDIVRVGFPFQVFERGGFIARNTFDSMALAGDILVAFAVSAVAGMLAARRTTAPAPQRRVT
jgi:hypothetical protein